MKISLKDSHFNILRLKLGNDFRVAKSILCSVFESSLRWTVWRILCVIASKEDFSASTSYAVS